MGVFLDLIKVARPYQWYKNLVVFIGIFFTGQLFDLNLLLICVIGFISLCLVSSGNYVINDIVDAKSDKVHPEKRSRPIAAGRICRTHAIIYATVLILLGLVIALLLEKGFLLAVLGLFVSTFAYSLWLKDEPFLDVIMIGINFMIRAISGVLLIAAYISPWLIIFAFFLAVFLALSKRKADLIALGSKAKLHKKTLISYTRETTDSLVTISAAVLLISFSLYSFMRSNVTLLYALPLLLYGMFRYIYLVDSGSPIGRHPHLFYKDKGLTIVGILTAIIVAVVFYV